MSKVTVAAAKAVAEKVDTIGNDELNVWLDWGFRLAKDPDVNVKALAEELYAKWHGISGSAVTFQMNSSAALMIARHFGTRAKADKAITDYNAAADRPSYKVRTLMNKLVGKDKADRKSALQLRLDLGVRMGIITTEQAKQLAALKV
jgi:hypothetical protein